MPIVIAVLFLFLMNWRASFITFLSMPASFAGGILVMHAFGIGINSMTLGGLAIAIGEVVDNGIVTVENVVSPAASEPQRRTAVDKAGTAANFEKLKGVLKTIRSSYSGTGQK